MTDTVGSGGEQLSALRRLVAGSLLPADLDRAAHVLALVADAAEALAPCLTVGIMLDGDWQDVGRRGRGADRSDVESALGSEAGKPVTVAGLPWASAFEIPGRWAGFLVVGAAAELTESHRDEIQALAKAAGTALESAADHVSEQAAAAELRAANQVLRRRTEIHDRLTQVALRGEGYEGLATAVYALTGHAAAVEDSGGNLMARAGPGELPAAQPERRADLLAQATAARGPIRADGCLVSVALLAGTPVGKVKLADPDGSAGNAERMAIEYAAAVLSMEAARVQSLGESQARARSNLVLDLVAGQDGPAILGRAQALGYDLSRAHRVVTIECGVSGNEEIDVFLHAVARAAAAARVGSLLAARTNHVIVLADTDARWDRFHAGVVAELRGTGCSIGVGARCEGVAEFPRSYRESQLALRIQKAVGGAAHVTVFDDLGVYQVLSAETDMSSMEAFVHDWLGALLDYDAVHGAQLVTTLSEYLESGGSYDTSATALSVHRSTLKYRLRRIREVSGYDLGVPDNQFNLQLATRAWRTLRALRQCLGTSAPGRLSCRDSELARQGRCYLSSDDRSWRQARVVDQGASTMSVSLSEPAYVHDLEEHLRVMLFETGARADPKAAVLLVRGVLARGDQAKAAQLAESTQRLAESRPSDSAVGVAALHVRGLVESDPALLDDVAGRYQIPLARAGAIEDAGLAWAGRGRHDDARARLRQAYELYERLGNGPAMARVRAELRAAGVRMHHWKRSARPAYGWDSLTDTERRIADLVASGLSNRQVASQVFLSAHTVAFHLRHIFWKLGVTSRVELARLATQQAAPAG
jgi:sugar diacid utilization regulator/DNA-binding CsgD family transcriptional regulator